MRRAVHHCDELARRFGISYDVASAQSFGRGEKCAFTIFQSRPFFT